MIYHDIYIIIRASASFVQTKTQFEEERLARLMEKAAARSTIRTTLDPLLEVLIYIYINAYYIINI